MQVELEKCRSLEEYVQHSFIEPVSGFQSVVYFSAVITIVYVVLHNRSKDTLF